MLQNTVSLRKGRQFTAGTATWTYIQMRSFNRMTYFLAVVAIFCIDCSYDLYCSREVRLVSPGGHKSHGCNKHDSSTRLLQPYQQRKIGPPCSGPSSFSFAGDMLLWFNSSWHLQSFRNGSDLRQWSPHLFGIYSDAVKLDKHLSKRILCRTIFSQKQLETKDFDSSFAT